MHDSTYTESEQQVPTAADDQPQGVNQSDVDELVTWGFEEPAVRTALEAADGDKEAAANMLLG